jgi:hypothetical protein
VYNSFAIITRLSWRFASENILPHLLTLRKPLVVGNSRSATINYSETSSLQVAFKNMSLPQFVVVKTFKNMPLPRFSMSGTSVELTIPPTYRSCILTFICSNLKSLSASNSYGLSDLILPDHVTVPCRLWSIPAVESCSWASGSAWRIDCCRRVVGPTHCDLKAIFSELRRFFGLKDLSNSVSVEHFTLLNAWSSFDFKTMLSQAIWRCSDLDYRNFLRAVQDAFVNGSCSFFRLEESESGEDRSRNV